MNSMLIKNREQIGNLDISEHLRRYLERRIGRRYASLDSYGLDEMHSGHYRHALATSEIMKTRVEEGETLANDKFLVYYNGYLTTNFFELMEDGERQTEAVIFPERLCPSIKCGNDYLDRRVGLDSEDMRMLLHLFFIIRDEFPSHRPETIMGRVTSEYDNINDSLYVAHRTEMHPRNFAVYLNQFIRNGISYKFYLEDKVRRFERSLKEFKRRGNIKEI